MDQDLNIINSTSLHGKLGGCEHLGKHTFIAVKKKNRAYLREMDRRKYLLYKIPTLLQSLRLHFSRSKWDKNDAPKYQSKAR